jgi:hypothetical protein
MVGLGDALSDAVGSLYGIYEGLDIGCVWWKYGDMVVFQENYLDAVRITAEASACE